MAHSDEHPGDVHLPPDADVPAHGPGDVVGECVGTEEHPCDEVVTIDRSSLHFIADAAGIPREEALLCEACMNERLDSLTLDLSIGTAHTRSAQFQGDEDDDDEEEEDQDDEQPVAATAPHVYAHSVDRDDGSREGYIRLPKAATSAIKRAEWELSHRRLHDLRTENDTAPDDDLMVYAFDLAALDHVTEHLTAEGWEVTIEPGVREAAGEAKRQSDRDWSDDLDPSTA